MSGNLPFAPRVHLLAGLNGAGKTTFARQLEADLPAVRFTLDEWPRPTARMLALPRRSGTSRWGKQVL